MTDQKKKPKSPGRQTPVHTLRRGDVRASIYRRCSNTGYVYYEFMLTRSWRTSTGRDAQAAPFFPTNEGDLVEAARATIQYIRETIDKRPVQSASQDNDSTVT